MNDLVFDIDVFSFAFLVAICVIGMFGNIHVIVVYLSRFKSSNHRILVLAMATTDLFACMICMPYDIFYTLYQEVTINNTGYCELDEKQFTSCVLSVVFLYLEIVCCILSLVLLLLVAFERLRKICQPYKPQFTIKHTKYACLLALLICAALGSPCFYLLAKNPLNYMVLVYTTFIGTIVGSVFIFSSICYARVMISLRKQMQNLFRDKLIKKQTLTIYAIISSSPNLEARQSQDAGNTNTGTGRRKKKEKRLHKFAQSFRKSVVFIAASIISYSSTFVTLITMIIKLMPFSEFLGGSTYEYPILFYIHYIVHSVNPVVYLILDSKYRKECRGLYMYV